jgi:hypothetical protein
MAITYTKRPSYIPNGYRRYQPLQIQGPPKFTQIGNFGFKVNHLATLRERNDHCLDNIESTRSKDTFFERTLNLRLLSTTPPFKIKKKYLIIKN